MTIDAVKLLGLPQAEAVQGGVTVERFRVDYPEFGDTTRFPDAAVERQLRMAASTLSEQVWGEQWADGIELRTAHYLTLGARNAALTAAGGLAGTVAGLMTSKQVDKVSASYDVSATTIQGAGFWNTTAYGVQFYQLLLMMGAGPIQV